MKTAKKLLVCILSVLLISCTLVFTAGAEETGFLAEFVISDGSGSVTVYNTQDYTTGTTATSTYARNSDTGEIDVSGDGQINFTVVPNSGYAVDTVTATAGTYKNIKTPTDTGKDNTYRITKVTGDMTVSITLKSADESGETEETPTSGEATVNFTDSAATITAGTDAGLTIEGTAVTVSLPGTYTFEGSCADGNILVAKNAGDVEIVLNGLTLTSTTTAPIATKSGTTVKIKSEKGTVNTLCDTNRDAASPKSCINAGGSLEFSGKGTLNVTGNNKNGIKADENVTIKNTILNVTSLDNSIAADNVLTIESGTITCTSTSGDCLKSGPDAITDTTLGNITITGGTFKLTANAGDAIQAINTVTIAGGTFEITTNGGSTTTISDTDEGSYKGIKSDSILVISGGTFNINTADDAIHSDNSVSISGGEFTIAAGDDGIHADTVLNITDGNITITTCYEGLESTDITIDKAYIDITASDDGINICGGTDNSGFRPGFGMGNTQDDDTAEAGTLTFNGGTVIVNARGDGLDSNGDIVMNGGTVIVNGPTSNGDGAIDYETGFTMNGGTVIAVGSSGMASGMTGGTQASLMFTVNGGNNNGSLCIKDSSGNVIAAFTPAKSYQSVVFSSADVKNGESYTLYTGCTVSGDSTGGLYTASATCTGGTKQATSTASTKTSGNGGMGGGDIPGGRGGDQGGTSFFSRIIEFFRNIINKIKSLFGIN